MSDLPGKPSKHTRRLPPRLVKAGYTIRELETPIALARSSVELPTAEHLHIHLIRHGQKSVRELMQKFGLDRATTLSMLRSLVKQGKVAATQSTEKVHRGPRVAGVVRVDYYYAVDEAAPPGERRERRENPARKRTDKSIKQPAEFWFEDGFDPETRVAILRMARDRASKPHANCQLESTWWACALRNDFNVELHHGMYQDGEDEQGHAWLSVDGSIFDPTADQFENRPDSSMEYSVHEVVEADSIRCGPRHANPVEQPVGTVRYLGTSDDVTTCDCCGRSDLKSTVALSIDDGDPLYYGVVCAARALRIPAKDVRKVAKDADDAKYRAEQAAKQAKERAAFDHWDAWLKAHGAGADVFTRIQSLGGFAAARAAYQAEHPNRASNPVEKDTTMRALPPSRRTNTAMIRHPNPAEIGTDRAGNQYFVMESILGAGTKDPESEWVVTKLTPDGHITTLKSQYADKGDAVMLASELSKNRNMTDARALVAAHRAGRGAKRVGGKLAASAGRGAKALGSKIAAGARGAYARTKAAIEERRRKAKAAKKRKSNPAYRTEFWIENKMGVRVLGPFTSYDEAADMRDERSRERGVDYVLIEERHPIGRRKNPTDDDDEDDDCESCGAEREDNPVPPPHAVLGWRKLNEISREMTGLDYRDLPDDGPEQDAVMGVYEKWDAKGWKKFDAETGRLGRSRRANPVAAECENCGGSEAHGVSCPMCCRDEGARWLEVWRDADRKGEQQWVVSIEGGPESDYQAVVGSGEEAMIVAKKISKRLDLELRKRPRSYPLSTEEDDRDADELRIREGGAWYRGNPVKGKPTFGLTKSGVEIVLSAIDTHTSEQLSSMEEDDPEEYEAEVETFEKLERKLRRAKSGARLTAHEARDASEALDSYIYWELSDQEYRSSGYVREPGSNDESTAELIAELQGLAERLSAFARANTPAAKG